jgi:Flp pilus assembly protein TadB
MAPPFAGPLQGVQIPAVAAEGAVGAALLATSAAIITISWPRRQTWERRLAQRERERAAASSAVRDAQSSLRLFLRAVAALVRPLTPPGLLGRLSASLRAAASDTTPEEVISIDLVLTLLLAAGMLVMSSLQLVSPLLAAAVVPLPTLWIAAHLLRRASRRREAIAGQLPILVDLMALEQSGGGIGARRAMELVVSRVGGDAAGLLRGCLAGSAATGTASLDELLEQRAAQFQVPALAALAAVVRLQRREGISAAAPLGRLARSMRDRQRDDFTIRGKRALVTMLLPVATCILLPFVLIILYPALERLSSALA